MAGHGRETIALAVIALLAAWLRLHDLLSKAGWDSDQGTIMFTLSKALSSGSIPQLGLKASVGPFHHGALYMDLMIPGAWLGGGSPAGPLVETALCGFLVVPMVWLVARSIAGPAAGLSAALLAASAGGLVFFSDFIWNPTLVEPGSALSLLGAWRAWSSRRPAWLLAVGAGTAVAVQAHLAASVLLVPMGMAFVALLWRGPRGSRGRILLWGLAAVALIAATYIPLLLHELSHDFSEARAILDYAAALGSPASHGLVYRLAVGGSRTVTWPLTGWPLWGGAAFLPAAIAVTGALAAGLAWRLAITAAPDRWMRRMDPAGSEAPASEWTQAARTLERDGTWFVTASIAVIATLLAVGVRETSEINRVLTEQYHLVADPFVIVAAGVLLGSLWRLGARRGWAGALGRSACLAALAGSVACSSAEWPVAPNPSSWSAAQAATARIEGYANGRPIALVGLPGNRSTDAYGYPLFLDGVAAEAPDRAGVLVVLCDSTWTHTCGGQAETAWLADQPYGPEFVLRDRFEAAPLRTLSIYVR